MEAGGGEVHVAGHILAGFDGDVAEDVLGATALMGGDDVLGAEELLHGGLQMEPVAAAGIGFVALHQAAPLLVAHGVGAGVGEQVDIDILRIDQEGVVAGLLGNFLPLGAGVHFNGLNGLDTEGLSGISLV